MPRVRNVHRRALPCTMPQAQTLLRSLASHEDRLWPGARWWPQRFEGGLVPGAKGGHGPVKYRVESVSPRSVVYRFPRRGWFRGTHRFDLVDAARGVELVHTLEGTLHGRGLVLWPLLVRPLHDALVEDVLAQAAAVTMGERTQWPPQGPYVRFLRRRVLHLGHS